jgi:hypothetical protein
MGGVGSYHPPLSPIAPTACDSLEIALGEFGKNWD